MSRTIHVDLFSPSSIDAAIRELRDYQKWVESKAVELRKRVAQLIRDRAEPVFQSAIADYTFLVRRDGKWESDSPVIGGVTVSVENNGDISLVITSGKDAVFIEFGAGIHYNGSVGSSPHPLGAGLGYTIGSYGENGAKEAWGFYGDDGELHLTRGVPASMPLYNAMMAVVNEIVDIAREVFST